MSPLAGVLVAYKGLGGTICTFESVLMYSRIMHLGPSLTRGKTHMVVRCCAVGEGSVLRHSNTFCIFLVEPDPIWDILQSTFFVFSRCETGRSCDGALQPGEHDLFLSPYTDLLLNYGCCLSTSRVMRNKNLRRETSFLAYWLLPRQSGLDGSIIPRRSSSCSGVCHGLLLSRRAQRRRRHAGFPLRLHHYACVPVPGQSWTKFQPNRRPSNADGHINDYAWTNGPTASRTPEAEAKGINSFSSTMGAHQGGLHSPLHHSEPEIRGGNGDD